MTIAFINFTESGDGVICWRNILAYKLRHLKEIPFFSKIVSFREVLYNVIILHPECGFIGTLKFILYNFQVVKRPGDSSEGFQSDYGSSSGVKRSMRERFMNASHDYDDPPQSKRYLKLSATM